MVDRRFGLDRLNLEDGEHSVDVTIGSEGAWDRTHLRRLRQSGELPGLVPVIDADFSQAAKIPELKVCAVRVEKAA